MDKKKFVRTSIYAGNIVEHYDKALYGVLAPFVAPLFFPNVDELTALMLTYLIYPVAMMAKPAGSLLFGYIGDRSGRAKALSYSLMGMAVATIGMGLLPTYEQAGRFAPVILLLIRAFQNFCAAGESVGGAIYLLEEKKSSLVSSLFSASTIAGILLASAAVATLGSLGLVVEYWRYLYLAGGSTALIAAVIRRYAPEQAPLTQPPPLRSLLTQWRVWLPLTLAAGFSYSNYMIALVLMNGLVPIVTDISKETMISANTGMLILDFIALPIIGWLVINTDPRKVLCFTALIACAIAAPMFTLLQGATLPLVLAIRSVMVLIGVCFAATHFVWAHSLSPKGGEYTMMALTYAVGAHLFGAPAASASLWLYRSTGSLGAAALYWALLAFATGASILLSPKVSYEHAQPA